MANDWTRLLEETAVHGSPDALRAYYTKGGMVEGALITGAAFTVLAGSAWIVNKVRDRSIQKKVDARVAESTLDDSPGSDGNPSDGGDTEEK